MTAKAGINVKHKILPLRARSQRGNHACLDRLFFFNSSSFHFRSFPFSAFVRLMPLLFLHATSLDARAALCCVKHKAVYVWPLQNHSSVLIRIQHHTSKIKSNACETRTKTYKKCTHYKKKEKKNPNPRPHTQQMENIKKSVFSTKYCILKAYLARKVKVKCLFHWGNVNKDSSRSCYRTKLWKTWVKSAKKKVFFAS